jgi:hypothetical protein
LMGLVLVGIFMNYFPKIKKPSKKVPSEQNHKQALSNNSPLLIASFYVHPQVISRSLIDTAAKKPHSSIPLAHTRSAGFNKNYISSLKRVGINI